MKALGLKEKKITEIQERKKKSADIVLTTF